MKRLTILFVFISGFAGAQAQLSVESFNLSSDTVNSSTTNVTLTNIIVHNSSFLSAFSDSLYLGLGVEDSALAVQTMDTTYVGVQSIAINDSVTIFSALFDVSPALFKEGNNTVVIWPYSNGGATLDSLFFNMTFLGVNDLTNNNLPVILGPNPASESFFLFDPQNLVKHVRIRSAEGKLIRSAHSNSLIWVNDFVDGIYFVELETASGIFSKKLIIR
jgi:hypothetical protein